METYCDVERGSEERTFARRLGVEGERQARLKKYRNWKVSKNEKSSGVTKMG